MVCLIGRAVNGTTRFIRFSRHRNRKIVGAAVEVISCWDCFAVVFLMTSLAGCLWRAPSLPRPKMRAFVCLFVFFARSISLENQASRYLFIPGTSIFYYVAIEVSLTASSLTADSYGSSSKINSKLANTYQVLVFDEFPISCSRACACSVFQMMMLMMFSRSSVGWFL